jgi:ribulose-5-phosphate 4-epimerase/fuculose-1-phosphate aldolase
MLETICEVLEDAYKRNWITSRDGNVSIRHHDRDHFISLLVVYVNKPYNLISLKRSALIEPSTVAMVLASLTTRGEICSTLILVPI